MLIFRLLAKTFRAATGISSDCHFGHLNYCNGMGASHVYHRATIVYFLSAPSRKRRLNQDFRCFD
jgi:hypothetical protein